MRSTLTAWVCVIAAGLLASAVGSGAQTAVAGEQFAGTWTGAGEGAGSGGLELTLAKGKNGAMTGQVSVTGDPTYKAVFKTLTFDGNKMAAKYDFPPDESTEVVVAVTFDGKTATGTWSAREKASGADAAAGTLKLTRGDAAS